MGRLIFMGLAMVICSGAVLGCTGSDDPDECDIYCREMTDCYEMLHQPFSRTKCERECRDDQQAADLVGCEDDYLELLECRGDMSCTEANDVGSECADEIDDLNRCLD